MIQTTITLEYMFKEGSRWGDGYYCYEPIVDEADVAEYLQRKRNKINSDYESISKEVEAMSDEEVLAIIESKEFEKFMLGYLRSEAYEA